MKPWQITLEERLASRDAPAVLSRDLLARFARAGYTHALAPSSLTYWLRSTKARGKLAPIQRGLFLNRFRSPAAQLADAAPWLRVDAVVSLNTVLGDAGVLNNPSRVVTAVVPMDRHAPPPRLGRQRTQAGTFHFFGIPRRILAAGEPVDRLDQSGKWEHPRASPEKALLDWLYLAASPRSHRTWPPRADIDLAMLDSRRLARLAKTTGLGSVLADWLQGSANHG
ncbi:MAG: hypothetical protein ACRESI_04225, partial [Gammaproteobacteria bacterium]